MLDCLLKKTQISKILTSYILLSTFLCTGAIHFDTGASQNRQQNKATATARFLPSFAAACSTDSLPYQISCHYICRFCGPFFYEFTIIIWQVFIFYGWSVVLRTNPSQKKAETFCNFPVLIKYLIDRPAPVEKMVWH